ncbi:AraC family transcriptional regulator [Paenibacillus peoriae]|uniref:helix-turn-helix transcriptional regulator n=1 Tax=Paenibacillus peoriae TaxID=59893 RepID=UPI00026C5C74|nr:AraC family transcriptional regulator [Paenibacillus peoriae]MEC0184685.1 AraC family transcriptional regulator [Paenibacillus peoriae]
MYNAEQVEFHIQEENAKNKGNDLLTYLLDCVRRGSCGEIRDVLKDSFCSDITSFIVGNDFSVAHSAFQYVLPQIVRASLDSGLPWLIASELYLNYTRKAAQMNAVQPMFELYFQMFLDFAEQVFQRHANNRYSPLVRKCHSYIDSHLYEPLSVKQIAKELQISRSHLAHVYKRETGKTISNYVRKMKINEAKKLLQHTALPLVQIGERLSYCSQSHFTESFRRATGMTPSQFRSGYLSE